MFFGIILLSIVRFTESKYHKGQIKLFEIWSCTDSLLRFELGKVNRDSLLKNYHGIREFVWILMLAELKKVKLQKI